MCFCSVVVAPVVLGPEVDVGGGSARVGFEKEAAMPPSSRPNGRTGRQARHSMQAAGVGGCVFSSRLN